ncbi:nucleotide exchange factor GrpE [Actinomadura spongiicola]|uniref:nucleotide exchange factor GrpE n=1 Tax=Actinomadura spongiicola TaxID=2303421 RepID=UPI001F46CE96|nr:nucleotide exchange factor GrpE [Actinomadura spongiicola]
MSRDGEPRVGEDSGTEPGPEPGAGSRRAPCDVEAALAGLAARLDREHERAAHREAVIDRLHEENQRLRRGELQAMLEPVRAALYRLHDQARRESARLAAPDLADPPDPKRTALLLAAVADDVADALARLGVERFTVEPGTPYDAVRHRPVAVTPVEDPLRDGTVTAIESDGFEQGGRVLRKAVVSVGRLVAERAGTAATERAEPTEQEDPTPADPTQADLEQARSKQAGSERAGSEREDSGRAGAESNGAGPAVTSDTSDTSGTRKTSATKNTSDTENEQGTQNASVTQNTTDSQGNTGLGTDG